MQTNFFSQLKNLNDFTISLSISYNKENDNMMVSFVPVLQTGADPALKKITPFSLSSSPEQLDENFLNEINTPITHTMALVNSTTQYMAQLEEIKKTTKLEADKAEKLKKKEKELKELMGENNSLVKENNSKIKGLISQIKEIDPENNKAKAAQEELLKTTQNELF